MRTKESTLSTFDGFPNKLLVRAPVLFGIIFYPLICSIILCKVFPSVWKVARITPVFKSGSRNSIMCFRPIGLVPKISLIFEKLLFRFLFSNLKSKLHTKQFGFQSQKSSVLQLIHYLESVCHEKSRNRFSVLFDYEKAFDKVPHSILLRKPSLYLDYDFCSLFETYLMNRYQYVHVNDLSSHLLPCVNDVPQGTVFGPFLFLIFVNDLPSIFLDCMVWLFADDLKLLFSNLNFHDDLWRLYFWNLINGMIINSDEKMSSLFRYRSNNFSA